MKRQLQAPYFYYIFDIIIFIAIDIPFVLHVLNCWTETLQRVIAELLNSEYMS